MSPVPNALTIARVALVPAFVMVATTIISESASGRVVGVADSRSCEHVIASNVLYLSKNSDDVVVRDFSSNLSHYVYNRPSCWTSRNAVRVAALLSSHDDFVRGHAAIALGYMGSHAKAAVRALEEALRVVDDELRSYFRANPEEVMMPEVWSGYLIREALRRITGQPVPDFQSNAQ